MKTFLAFQVTYEDLVYFIWKEYDQEYADLSGDLLYKAYFVYQVDDNYDFKIIKTSDDGYGVGAVVFRENADMWAKHWLEPHTHKRKYGQLNG